MQRKTADALRLVLGVALIASAAIAVVYQQRRDGARTAESAEAGETAQEARRGPFHYEWLDDGTLWMAGSTMGRISYQVRIVPGSLSRETTERLAHGCYDALERVNRVMSAYRPDSDLARVNEAPGGQAVVVDEALFALLQIARRSTDLTGGAFDPTARRLFRLWSAVGKADRLPTEAELADARQQTGWATWRLDSANRTVTKTSDSLQIDLGAIAKGYAVDQVVAVLTTAGAVGGLVEVGGDLRVFGTPVRGDHWIVGIRHPFESATSHSSYCGTLRVTDRAVASSGNYFRYVTIQGKQYSHIIDPRTGRPATAAPSVTVLADDCTTADVWATALSVLGPEGLAKIEAIDGLEAIMIVGDRSAAEVVMTPGFGAYVERGIDPTPIQ